MPTLSIKRDHVDALIDLLRGHILHLTEKAKVVEPVEQVKCQCLRCTLSHILQTLEEA